MSNPPDNFLDALNFLKGQDNPFASLARPQRLDQQFRDLHVPALLQRDRVLLEALIDHYRLESYTRATDLKETRLVTVVGNRGAGKTHLVRTLELGEPNKPRLIVRPSYYQPQVPFNESILDRLVARLYEEDEFHGNVPIKDVAQTLTRRLLAQAMRALEPTERMLFEKVGWWQKFRLLRKGGEKLVKKLDLLTTELEKEQGETDICEVLNSHQVDVTLAHNLLNGHLNRFEKKNSIRLDLYKALVKLALREDFADLDQLLKETPENEVRPRQEWTNELLHYLIEACALVRMPVVFCYDDIENLLGPTNEAANAERHREFWKALANAIDNTKGLLFLFFVEQGAFRESANLIDSYVQARILQGVPLQGQGLIANHPLGKPAEEELRVLIDHHVRAILKKYPRLNQLPSGFPFSLEFLQKQVFCHDSYLRDRLLLLRDEYQRVVFGPSGPVPPIVSPPPPFERCWHEALASQQRVLSMSNSVTQHFNSLHNGLGSLLQMSPGLESHGAKLDDVQPDVTIGQNAKYGHATILDWAPSQANGDGKKVRVGVGFLLAGGSGMRADLEAKFDLFKDRTLKADRLLVLWYTVKDADNLADELPEQTRNVWQKSRYKSKAELRAITIADLTALLALAEWKKSVRDQSEGEPPTEAAFGAFLAKQREIQALLELIQPSEPVLKETVSP